ncbi:MAG: phosphoribosyltransferase [Sulfitobacter sp.]
MRTDVWQELRDDLPGGVQPDQESFAVDLGAGAILLPIRALGDGQRGVASLILNQASFAVLDVLADALAARLAPYAPDVIVAVPTLGLPLAEAVARRLGHARMIPLSNSRKFWYEDALSVEMSSITSPGPGKRLYLDPRMVPLLRGRVAVIDDVLSTGSSIGAVLRLLAQQQIAPAVIGAAMLQGDAWRDQVACPVEGAFCTPILQRGAGGWQAP